MAGPANSINEQTTGICGFTGTAFVGTPVTQYNVITGSSTSSTLNNVAPSATSGVPLISQGAASQPIFGTAVVAGGGTGATTLAANGVLYGNTTSPVGVTAAGTNGQVLIAATAAAPAFASITSSDSSLTFVTGANALDITVAGGATTGKTITGNTGGALSPTAGNWNIVGTGSTTTSGAVSTLTVQMTGLTDHNVLVGAGTATITKVAPSATSGVPLVSQGAASDPAFGTAVVAGGGTGNTTFTAYSVICAGTTATGAFQNVSGLGTATQVLTSNGAGSLPSWQDAPGSTSANTVISLADDFLFHNTDDGVSSALTSVYTWYEGFFASNTDYSTAANPGVLGNQAFASTGASLFLSTDPTQIYVGGGAISLNWIIKLANLSNGTNRYTIQCGLANAAIRTSGLTSPTNGIYFQYSDNVNSGNWQGICRAASVSSTASSAVAAVDSTFVNLGIVINAAGTSVSFFINGTEIANSPLASNIPSVAINPFFQAVRGAGTISAGSVLVDLFYYTNTLTVAR